MSEGEARRGGGRGRNCEGLVKLVRSGGGAKGWRGAEAVREGGGAKGCRGVEEGRDRAWGAAEPAIPADSLAAMACAAAIACMHKYKRVSVLADCFWAPARSASSVTPATTGHHCSAESSQPVSSRAGTHSTQDNNSHAQVMLNTGTQPAVNTRKPFSESLIMQKATWGVPPERRRQARPRMGHSAGGADVR